MQAVFALLVHQEPAFDVYGPDVISNDMPLDSFVEGLKNPRSKQQKFIFTSARLSAKYFPALC